MDYVSRRRRTVARAGAFHSRPRSVGTCPPPWPRRRRQWSRRRIVPNRLPEAPKPAALPPPTASVKSDANPDNMAIAEELIRRLPVGKFKVADAHGIFRDKWPAHPAATGPAQLGTFLLKEIWPIMQRRGVVMAKEKSPRTYEITPEAKGTVGKPASSAVRSAKATPERLAAAVAAGITDDVFSATHALAALKDHLPEHPAASYTAQRFGNLVRRNALARHGTPRRHPGQGKAPPLRDDAGRPAPAHQPGLAVSTTVIPAKAGIQNVVICEGLLDSCLRRNDGLTWEMSILLTATR